MFVWVCVSRQQSILTAGGGGALDKGQREFLQILDSSRLAGSS